MLYDSGFARGVYALEGGAQVRRCMQCGVCSQSSPPSRLEMDYTPRRLFSLIRAGRKEEVFKRQYHLGLHFLLHMGGPLPQGYRYSRRHA